MKALSFYLIALILAPVTLAGLVLLLVGAPGLRQRTGLGWPALASLAHRWLLHEFDDREDPSAQSLVKALPAPLDTALRLVGFATITGAHLTGYRPAVLRYQPGEPTPGAELLPERLAFVDEVLADCLPRVRQVVIFDAGVNTYTCEELAGRDVRVFEVVDPAIAHCRRRLFADAGIHNDAIEVEFDLLHAAPERRLAPSLAAAGLDLTLDTLFLIEGQLSRCERGRVQALLTELASLPARTLVAFDYVASDYTDPTTSAVRPGGLLARWLDAPLRFGLPTFSPARVPLERFLASCGDWSIERFDAVGAERPGFRRARAGLVLASSPPGQAHVAEPAAAQATAAPAADAASDTATAPQPEPAAPHETTTSATTSAAGPAHRSANAAAQADDLKRIKGIGPRLEQLLHENGITRYEQVAALDDAAIAELDDKLRFRGRIQRDDWVGQARALLNER